MMKTIDASIDSVAIAETLSNILKENGVGDVGFAKATDGICGLPYSLSIVVPLSNAIIDEIDSAPTHTYFNHYRTVNTFIDQIAAYIRSFFATARLQICNNSCFSDNK